MLGAACVRFAFRASTSQTIKNLLNWTHPPKTALVYALVAVVWLCLLVVPGRYLILALGLYEFSKAWLGMEPPATDGPPPLAIKLKNLLTRCEIGRGTMLRR